MIYNIDFCKYLRNCTIIAVRRLFHLEFKIIVNIRSNTKNENKMALMYFVKRLNKSFRV